MKRLIVIILFCSVIILPLRIFASSTPSPWLTALEPEFATRRAVISESNYPSTFTQRGNLDCDTLSFTKRDGDVLPYQTLHKESTISGCFLQTKLGLIEPNGYAHISGTPYVAETVAADNSAISVFALPNTDLYISHTSSKPVDGSYIWFDRLSSSLALRNDKYGRMRAVITPHFPQPLSDRAGNLLQVMSDNFSVSANGEWAIVDSPGHGMLRIDLTNMEVLPFMSSFELGNGIGGAIRTAISSDGRYAVVASKAYNYFGLYDLSTCGYVPTVITTHIKDCQTVNLDAAVRNKLHAMGGILQVRFLNNNLLKFFASYDTDTSSKIGEFVLAPAGMTTSGMDYIALGDSFSSGEGAHSYEVGTDEKNYNLCHLSRRSYPYLIAHELKANSFHSVACSGATTTNVIGSSGYDRDLRNVKRDNQYNDRPDNNSLGDWIPGYKKQLAFISENSPRMVTVSAIGNDIGFQSLIESCVGIQTCYPTYEDRIEILNQIDATYPTLLRMFEKTKTATVPDAQIYAIGYPHIGNKDGICAVNVHLNKDELELAELIITRLNTVIKTAAQNAGIYYADIEKALYGYRLCEGAPGVTAMNGLTAGRDIYGILGNESFHPNELGQFLIATKILNNIKESKDLLLPQKATTLPSINTENPALKTTPKTNRTLNKRMVFAPDSNIVTVGEHETAKLDSSVYATPPNSIFTMKLDGNILSTLPADGNGNLSVDLLVPTTTLSGYHVIEIIGEDITGQPIAISGYFVYEGSLANSCVVVRPSNQDADNDGIDDACDGNIVITNIDPRSQLPPAVAATTNSTLFGAGANQSVRDLTKTTIQEPAKGKVLGASTDIQSAATRERQNIRLHFSAHPLILGFVILIILFSLTVVSLHHTSYQAPKYFYKTRMPA